MLQSPVSTLQEGLKKFGLDPREWMLTTAGPRSIVVRHREDQDFSFTGRVRRRGRRLEWLKLELRSI